MIQQTTEARIAEVIESKIPTIEMHAFRAPAKFDGGKQPHYGFFNTSTGNAIESFTAKEGYEMTTHDDYAALAAAALDAMECEGEIKALWTESKSLSQATIIVCPTKEERKEIFDIGGKDSIWPRLIIEAPFGRTFKVRGGLYRDACRNLDIPRQAGKGFETTIRHTSQLRNKMEDLIAVCRASCNFEDMATRLNQLDQVEISINEALAELYPLPENASDNVMTRARNRAAAIYQRIHREAIVLDGKMRDDGKASLWRIVSAVTGYVQHDKTRKKGMNEVDRAVMGINDSESLAVWGYADKMLTA